MPKTTDALLIMEKRFGPIDEDLLAEFRQQMDIAQKLYDMRTERGLSQAEVANLVGTTAAVIERMEESDYNVRRSQQILEKVAKELGYDNPLAFASGTAAGTV
jgi:ribosome-binding protein aMBF1 (putative translation factor)